MIRRSPAEYYLKYLLVRPNKLDDEQIMAMCYQQHLDCPGEEYLERLRVKAPPPNPFYPTDRLHIKSQRFLFREKIQQLFLPDQDMLVTLKLLAHARAKEFVEAMTLSGAPPPLIASALGSHRNFPCSEKSVQYYLHFFWNTELVDSTELRALLQLRAPPDEVLSDKEKKVGKVYNKAFRDDPRVVAASLPNSPLVAMMSQMKMGIMPRNLDLVDAIEAARRMATLRSLEATMMGGAFDSKRALDYSLVAKHMSDMLEMVVRPDEKMREDLASIALRTEEGPVPYIHDLSNGSHTLELSPKAITNESSGNEPVSDSDPE